VTVLMALATTSSVTPRQFIRAPSRRDSFAGKPAKRPPAGAGELGHGGHDEHDAEEPAFLSNVTNCQLLPTFRSLHLHFS
jgi:hypothetical protein